MLSRHTVAKPPAILVQTMPVQVVNGAPQYQVVIMADQKTPYAFLKQVMRACGEQQFGQVSFAVLREAKNV